MVLDRLLEALDRLLAPAGAVFREAAAGTAWAVVNGDWAPVKALAVPVAVAALVVPFVLAVASPVAGMVARWLSGAAVGLFAVTVAGDVASIEVARATALIEDALSAARFILGP